MVRTADCIRGLRSPLPAVTGDPLTTVRKTSVGSAATVPFPSICNLSPKAPKRFRFAGSRREADLR